MSDTETNEVRPEPVSPEEGIAAGQETKPKSRSRRRPRRKSPKPAGQPAEAGNEAGEIGGTAATVSGDVEVQQAAAGTSDVPLPGQEPKPKSRPRRRSRRKGAKPAGQTADTAVEPDSEAAAAVSSDVEVQPAAAGTVDALLPGQEPLKPKSRPRRRSRRKGAKPAAADGTVEAGVEAADTSRVAEEDLDAVDVNDDESPFTKTPSGKKTKGKAAAADKTVAGPRVKLLINAEEPEECRIALIENGRVESFHVTTVVREQSKSNIYKAKVVAIESSLQAVFVDMGTGKNGFLPFSEIHPEYYDTDEPVPPHWKDVKTHEVIRKGQEMLVQVVKEATGNKGASITTVLSLPGSDSAGISRKIEDEAQRAQLREMMASFNLPEGIGYIIRTASQDITKTAISKDLRYLLRLWQDIKKRGQTEPAPALIYQDQDIIAKFLRDHYTPDIEEILVDSQEAYDQVDNFLSLLPAKQVGTTVRLHKGSRPIFNQFDVEDQIEQIYQPVVKLPSGGSIVINPTEALVSIDVNSGRTGKDLNFNEAIFKANMEAAAELARQLRLRDLGGLIVVDFIDMRSQRHIKEVEKQVKTSMKRDKAKVDISRISKFGLMQISRQKMGAPIQMGSYKVCEHCQGRGMIRSVETLSLYYLRRIQTGVAQKGVARVECRLPMGVAQYLLNKKRADLVEMERQYGVEIQVLPEPTMNPADNKIDFIKE